MPSLSCSTRTGSTLLVLLALLFCHSRAQAQTPTWQKVIKTAGGSLASASAEDANGNIYVAGYFQDILTLGTTTLTGFGQMDGFIAKWSSSANRFEWAQQIGGPYGDFTSSIAVSGQNVYVTGSFDREARFGNIILRGTGGGDGFVCKLLDTGSAATFQWVQQIRGAGNEEVWGVAARGADLYIAGEYGAYGTAATTLGSTTLTKTGTSLEASNVFIAKLVDAGTSSQFSWAKQSEGVGSHNVRSLAVNGTDILVTGAFRGAISFGGQSLTSLGGADMYVAKLSDAGNTGTYTWAKQAGGPLDEQASALAVKEGNVYVAGTFTSANANFGGVSLTNEQATYKDVFVTKLADAGTTSSFIWAQRGGGAFDDEVEALTVEGSHLYVAGTFRTPTLVLGSITLTNTFTIPTTFALPTDIFVAQLLDAGPNASYIWAKSAGGSTVVSEAAQDIGIVGGQLYVLGTIGSEARFDNITLPREPNGTRNAFLAFLGTTLLPTSNTGALPAPALTLSPNPTSAGTTLLGSEAGAAVQVVDAVGRLVFSTQADKAGKVVFSLPSGTPKGVYVVRSGVRAIRLLVE